MFVPAGGMNNSPYGTLLGRPIIPVEYCQTLGAAGDILFVDLSEYILAEKGTIRSALSIHVRFTYDETVLRVVWRLDGNPVWNAALTPYKRTNTQSPYIKLQSRT